jgi:hypothetical protein
MIAFITQWVLKKSGIATYLLIGLSAALGIALITLGFRELVNRNALAQARTTLATMQAERDLLRQQLEATIEVATSNQRVIDTLRLENERLVAQSIRIQAEADAAVAAARAAEVDANRTLNAWMDKYAQETRSGTDCAEALTTMEAACSALADY